MCVFSFLIYCEAQRWSALDLGFNWGLDVVIGGRGGEGSFDFTECFVGWVSGCIMYALLLPLRTLSTVILGANSSAGVVN